MQEKDLVRRLKKTLETRLPGAVVIKHSDAIVAGVPDLSVTWNGATTWLEVKHDVGKIISREIQRWMVKRLAIQGRCLYVVYRDRAKEGPRTYVISGASDVHEAMETVVYRAGHDHDFVAEAIRRSYQERIGG